MQSLENRHPAPGLPGAYLLTPLAFSNVLKPPIPSMPVITVHIRSRLSTGGAGQPLTAAHHASSGCRIVA